MNSASRILAVVVGLVLAAAAGVFGYQVGKANAPVVHDVTVDTVTVVRIDTIRVDRTVPFAVHVKDTITIHTVDTLLQPVTVQLPREEKEYRDSLYRAVVSGFRPSLDLIEVFPRTVYQTVTVTEAARKKRWGIGITAGYGVGLQDKSVIVTPYIGIGLTYNLLMW